MMNLLKKTSGSLFVKYLTFGLVTIFFSIALFKSIDFFGESNAIALGVVIFVINLITSVTW